MRYHVALPLTASPSTEAGTFSRSPGTTVPTTGALVDAAARTLACERTLAHQPPGASSPVGSVQPRAQVLSFASRSVWRPTYPSVVDHHVDVSPSIPGE